MARKRQATALEVAEEMWAQGVVAGHGAGPPSPLLWIPKAEEIPNATTDHRVFTERLCSATPRLL